jgi:hydroxymethylbilane synthase
VLVSRGERLAELASGARIGTGSPRRAVQLAACRPDLEACSIRGNIDTRLRKVSDGEFDAVILAAAGLKRLGWEGRVSEYLPAEKFLPAVGQGALAIEIRLDDEEMAKIAVTLNHLPTWQCITAERTFLSAMGGGCRAPIAALGAVSGDILQLDGMVAEVSKGKILRFSEEGSVSAPQELGQSLARKLLAMGAGEFIAEATKR